MKNFLFLLIAIIFVGCAPKGEPNIASHTSEPLFITADINASVYVNFKNSANGDESVNDEIKKEFLKNGYKIMPSAKEAEFIILGDVQSFERVIKRDKNSRFHLGVGYGYRPFWGIGYRFGFNDDFDDYATNSYFYSLNASVSIKKQGEIAKSTNITLSHSNSTYSRDHIWPYFKQRLARQVASFFYNIK